MGTIRNYPTPEGTVLQKDFQIRVRPPAGGVAGGFLLSGKSGYA